MGPWDWNRRSTGSWRDDGYKDGGQRQPRNSLSRDSREREVRDDFNGRDNYNGHRGRGERRPDDQRRYNEDRRYDDRGYDDGRRYDDRRHSSDQRPDDREYRSDRPPSKAQQSRDGERGYENSGDPDAMQNANVWLGGLPNDITEREIERVCSKYGPVHRVTIKHSARDTFAFAQFGQPSHAKEAIAKLDQSVAFGAGVIKVAPASRKPQAGAGGGAGGGDDGRDDDRKRAQHPAQSRREQSEHGGGGRGRQEYRKERAPPAENGQRNAHYRDRSRSREQAREKRSPSPAQPRRQQPYRVHLSQLPKDMEGDELQEICAEYGKVNEYELHREGAYKCGWVEYASKEEAEKAVADLDDRRMDEWSMRLQAYSYPRGF